MPAAKTPRGRLRQVELWLASEFPTPVPTRVRVSPIKGGLLGICDRLKDRCNIRISPELVTDSLIGIAIETLFHEWSHALTMRLELLGHPKDEEHPDEGGIYNWRMLRSWHDEGGEADSAEFSPRPWR